MQNFGLKKISAITTKDNISSQKLIQKLGLEFKKFVTLPNDDEELMYFESLQFFLNTKKAITLVKAFPLFYLLK